MPSPEIEQAIQFIRSNRHSEARKILEPLISKDPQNITAWFWYVETCPEQATKLRVLETCLKLNPTNSEVRDVYVKLKEKLSAVEPLPATPPTPSLPNLPPISPSPKNNPPSANPIGQRFLYGILAMAAFTIILVAGYFGWDFLTRGDQGPVLLRLNLEPGRTYTERIVTDTNVSVGFLPGGSQKSGYRFSYAMQGTTAAGNLQIKVTYDWVMMALKQPTSSIVFDSSQSGSTFPPELAGYAALPGQAVTLDVSPQGQLLNLRGGEKILSKALKNVSTGATEYDINQQVGNLALVDTFTGAFPRYASRPVAIAEKWQASYVLQATIPLDVDCSYTLLKRHRGVATIASDCTLKLRKDFLYADIVSEAYDINGTLTGVVDVDEKSGWLISGKAENEITLTPLETRNTQDAKPPTQTLKSKIVIDQAGVK
jgi:hypothetical protein